MNSSIIMGTDDYIKIKEMEYQKGREDAIDEFTNLLCKYGVYDDYGNVIDILDIAKQLKGE